jgi:hypothetical protein
MQALRNDLLIKVGGKSKAMAGKYGQGYKPTLANVIATWAPPTENDTAGYIDHVAKAAGLTGDSVLTPADIERILPAMVQMEGGKQAATHFGAGKQYADAGNAMTDAQVDAPSGLEGLSDEELDKMLGSQVTDIPVVEQKMVKPPEKKGFIDSVGSGVHSALTKRGLGIIQTLDSAARELPAPYNDKLSLSSEVRAAIPAALEKANAEEAGTGVTGLVSGIAADPVNWMAAGRGVVSGGALTGGIGSFSQASDDPSKSLMDRNEDMATGAGIGAAAGKALQLAGGKTRDLAVGISDRVMTALGNTKASDRVIYRKFAEAHLDDGMAPDEVVKMIMKAEASKLRPTLGEATGSRGVLQYEKKIAQGAGAGATRFNKEFAKRGSEDIPGRLESMAADLKGPPGAVDDAYAAAQREGNDTIQASIMPEGAPIAVAPPGGSAANPELLKRLSETLANMQSGIDTRLAELGGVNNIEAKALQQAKAIMDNAKRRGGSFESILDAKKQLDDLFIESADVTSQKKANRYIVGHVKDLDAVLSQLAPANYPAAKVAARSRMAGRDIESSLSDARSGNVSQVVSDLWGSPGAREDLLSKIPSGASRQEVTDVFDILNNISMGFGGRPRPVAVEGVLPREFRGIASTSTSPIGLTPAITTAVGETFVPKLYESAAKISFAPDANRLAQEMTKQLEGSPIGRMVAGILGGQVGMRADQAPTKRTTNKE